MNIEQGEVFKNYKELCERLGEPVKDGNSKKAQLKEWEQRFSYQKQGYKIIITEVFSEPKEKVSRRRGGANNFKQDSLKNKLCKPLLDKGKNLKGKGIYAICLDKKIYIGSTCRVGGFDARFLQHTRGQQPHTKELLDNGGEFRILEDMTGCEEWEIREREQEYIDALLTTSEYELINKYEETVTFNKNIK